MTETSDAPAPTAAPIIRVLIADDASVTRLGIVTLINAQKDMQVVGEAEDGLQAVQLHNRLHPDVAVVDLRMPGLDGVEVTRLISHAQPPARVLILTSYDGEENIFQALKAGALGYLTKDAPGREIARIATAIRAVHRGERYLPAGVTKQLNARAAHPALSPRELQVLEGIARGLTNKEIAESLGIAPKTTQMFVSRVLMKLDVSSRTEAVAVAHERGLLGLR